MRRGNVNQSSNWSPQAKKSPLKPPSLLENNGYAAEVDVSLDKEETKARSGTESPTQSQKGRKENVQIYLRVRPLLVRGQGDSQTFTSREPGRASETILIENDTTVRSFAPPKSKAATIGETQATFTFNRVFGPTTAQEELFDATCKQLLAALFEGDNGLVFAYGITNSGKTFTILGSETKPGVLPQALRMLFEVIKTKPKEEPLRGINDGYREGTRIGQVSYKASVSYLEVYNEEVYDLLAPLPDKGKPRQKLKLLDHYGRVLIKGLRDEPISSAEEGLNLMEVGTKSRQVAETRCNTDSSRSHSVFTIKLTKDIADEDAVISREARLHIVDLAGSERWAKTGARGLRLKESSNINSSLMNLMRCIEALRFNQSHLASQKKLVVPFRHSKLTRLFQESLVGQDCGRTVMILNANPENDCYDEMLNTLKYGAITKGLITQAKVDTRWEAVPSNRDPRNYDRDGHRTDRSNASHAAGSKSPKSTSRQKRRNSRRRSRGARQNTQSPTASPRTPGGTEESLDELENFLLGIEGAQKNVTDPSSDSWQACSSIESPEDRGLVGQTAAEEDQEGVTTASGINALQGQSGSQRLIKLTMNSLAQSRKENQALKYRIQQLERQMDKQKEQLFSRPVQPSSADDSQQRDRAQLLQEIEQLQAALKQVEARSHLSLHTRLSEKEAAAEALCKSEEERRKLSENLESQSKAYQQAQTTIQDLETRISKQEAKLKEFLSAMQRVCDRLKEAEEERDKLRDENSELKQRAQLASSGVDAQRFRDLQLELQEMESHHDTLQLHHDNLLLEGSAKLEALNRQLEEQTARCAQLEAELVTQRRRYEALDSSKTLNGGLESALGPATGDIQVLQQNQQQQVLLQQANEKLKKMQARIKSLETANAELQRVNREKEAESLQHRADLQRAQIREEEAVRDVEVLRQELEVARRISEEQLLVVEETGRVRADRALEEASGLVDKYDRKLMEAKLELRREYEEKEAILKKEKEKLLERAQKLERRLRDLTALNHLGSTEPERGGSRSWKAKTMAGSSLNGFHGSKRASPSSQSEASSEVVELELGQLAEALQQQQQPPSKISAGAPPLENLKLEMYSQIVRQQDKEEKLKAKREMLQRARSNSVPVIDSKMIASGQSATDEPPKKGFLKKHLNFSFLNSTK